MAPNTKSAKAAKPAKVTRKFVIDASRPAGDKIFDVSQFEKFLHDKIKIDGRVGNLGDVVQISQEGDGKIVVLAHIQFSGRYLKYLYDLTLFMEKGRRWANRACVGPRSTLRSTNSGIGFASLPLRPVFTNLSSTMLSMMALMMMRIRFEVMLG
ncbi:unnamed protein product [Tuber aestivum]|uniref:Uncharacterized protein n=1 Tax=Tuber aestivum TaxID=59557 RepID=A0A292PS05_9PEZI|nr:unnamed protein product [Tuber aestivum]